MAQSDLRQANDALRRILKHEREALRRGLLAEAVSHAAPKSEALKRLEAAVGGLDQRSVDEALRRDVKAVRDLARANGALFAAAQRGLQSAIDRIRGGGVDRVVGAYGRDGGQIAFSRSNGAYRSRV